MLPKPSRPDAPRSAWWIDVGVLLGLVALVVGISSIATQWEQPLRTTVNIDLSPAALPKYMLFSFARGWIAYGFSLLFTLLVASWAYYDQRARRFVLPALDVLQSIPVLGFLPGLVLFLVGIFPHSNTGLELACVLTIFTGQVWNMAFNYHDSLRAIPAEFRLLGKLYGFNWWHRFWRIELPCGAQGLLYNSMVSMAGGWFFLITTEAFTLGKQDFRVPGIGSYMSVAMDRGDVRAQIFGIIAMGIIIVVVDRLVWWPLVVWSRRFKLDDFGGTPATPSTFQLWLARSRFATIAAGVMGKLRRRFLTLPDRPVAVPVNADSASPAGFGTWIYRAFIALVLIGVGWGAIKLAFLLGHVTGSDWREILYCTVISFGRVLAAVALGTLWTVPVGIWIGLNPRLAGRLQPFIQFAASFPAPMLYPWLVAVILLVGSSLQWGAIILILLGTQWYILFNVAASAAAIPNDIISCASLLRLDRWRQWTRFLLPAIFPGLVTGWVTAAGGAWNATIVAEYVNAGGKLYQATGLGALIQRATDAGNFSKLTAAVLVMAVVVVGINRTLWKKLQVLADNRCRFGL
ncbi:MAG: ABC transporter permease subunit [Lacunisphaera sp.]